MDQDVERILWGITSSGDMMREVTDLMIEVNSWGIWDIHVMLSRETPFVLRYYSVWDKIHDNFSMLMIEKGPNAPFLGGPIQRGRYTFLFIAPVTGNTMAKIACGIADSLVSNCVALALKAAIPVFLFPTDQMSTGSESILPDGTILKLYPREVDLNNVEKVSKMKHITVFESVEQIKVFFSREKAKAFSNKNG
ncbi:MAG: flavoprotein [Promethearchaeota archaeon]